MKYEEIIATVSTILTNKATLTNFIEFFGGENRFRMYQFKAAIKNNNSLLTEIKGIGPKLMAKIVAAFYGKFHEDKTFRIVHYNIADESFNVELHHTNNAFRYVENMGLDPQETFMFVDCRIDWFDPERDVKLAVLDNKIDNGIEFNGVVYKPLCTTASGAKKAQQIWCDEKHLNVISKRCRFGFNVNGVAMAPNKFFTRMGLCFSSSDPIHEVYPNFVIDYNKIAVLPDVYRNGKIRTDGAIYIIDGGNNLPSEAATLRPMLKGAAIPVNKREFLDIVGDQEVTDYWGNKLHLSEIQICAFASTFKFIELCKTRAEFIEKFMNSDLSVAVRMNKHQTKHIVYQAMQTLPLSKASIAKIEELGKSYLDGLSTLENYIKLIPPTIRKAACIYPAILNDKYVKDMAQLAHRKQRMMLRGGAIPNAGKFFCMTSDDVDAFKEGAGLKSGECCIKSLPEGYIVGIRYPHTSAASFVVLYNRHINNGITDPNVVVINNYDETLRKLGGADMDGDKIYLILNKIIAELVLGTLREMGDVSMPKAIEGKAKKVTFTKVMAAAIKKAYFMSVTQMSQIGTVSNKLSAAFAALYEAMNKLQEALETDDADAIEKAQAAMSEAINVVEYFQQEVELVVDIEKHGNFRLKKPEAVEKMNLLMCEFIMYAKIAKQLSPSNKKPQVNRKKYAFRGDSPLEQYSAYINANTVKSSDFCANVDGEFVADNLRFEGELPHLNAKVFRRGQKTVDENGKTIYVNHGLFDKIVFASTSELAEMGAERDLSGNATELRKALILRLMDVYAKTYTCELEDVYNLIVFYISSMGDAEIANTYKRVFWETLHEYAERALTERFGEAAIHADIADVDEIDDGSEEEEDENEEDIDY